MGSTVIHPVESRHEFIEWADVNLSDTSISVLWQAFNCTPNGSARDAIRKELVSRKEF